jgi:hypothetical protein
MDYPKGKYYRITVEKRVSHISGGYINDSYDIIINSGRSEVFKTRRKAYGFICKQLIKFNKNVVDFHSLTVWDLKNGGGECIKVVIGASSVKCFREKIDEEFFNKMFDTKKQNRINVLRKILK